MNGTLVALVLAAGAGDWPQFRGPGGCGVAADRAPAPVEFGPGKNEAWKTPVPPGLSSPCVWGDRIFLTGCDDAQKKLETLCLDRRDGRIVWRESVTAAQLEPVHKTNSHACATPACDGERVYVYFGSYGLVAYTVDGKPAWELRLPIPSVRFGSGTSPIIVGDLVILNRQQVASFPGRDAPPPKDALGPAASELVAVNRRTGAVAWRTEVAKAFFGAGYATPAADGESVIIAGGGKIQAFDVQTGAARWQVEGLPMVATASPAVGGGRVFLNCTGVAGDIDRVEPVPFETAIKQWDQNGDGKLQAGEIPKELAVFTRRRADHEGDFGLREWFFRQADADRDGALSEKEWDKVWGETADMWLARMKPSLVALRLGGTGNVTESHRSWQVHRGVPEVPSLLILGQRVYAVRNGGVLTCLDAATGKPHFEERLGGSGSYYASPVSDGERIYFVSQPGVVTVLKASDQFERLASNDLGEEVSATPAVVGGRLIVRTAGHLYAFGVGKR